ncbi:MAG: molybdopterin-synthase adenylyltransferase MoeB [Deltaproteobacteria bacterium]|nr:molybdopterin-synthase adenylyltransferase MoeB [Deltaproteobacteria bacterium]
MPTGKDLLKAVRAEIREIKVADVKRVVDAPGNGEKPIILDVREGEEVAEGHLPGAIALPRGFLELRIESKIPDKSTPVVVYCAGGNRSAFAARTLEEMGYGDVQSMAGGFGKWVEAGYAVVKPRSLTQLQKQRYSRHLLIPEVGEAGQLKLLDAKVLLIGAGGLGAPAALYLAAAGVGTLGIVDNDVVDMSNLQRQVIHTNDRVGKPKVESARATIAGLNPDVNVVAHELRLDVSNAVDIFSKYDVILDGTDNFATRYLINDVCVHLGKPNVHGSVYRFEGQATVFAPKKGGPCYRCLYPLPPPPELAPSCADAGVLGILPGIVGLLQSTEVVKLILSAGNPLVGRLVMYDALKGTFREMRLQRDPDCPMCGDRAVFKGFEVYEQFCSDTFRAAAG